MTKGNVVLKIIEEGKSKKNNNNVTLRNDVEHLRQ